METLAKLEVEVELQNPNDFGSLPSLEQLRSWCFAAIQTDTHEKAFEDSLSVLVRVVSSDESEALNSTYRGKQAPTNVLSFANDVPEFMLGNSDLKEQNSHLGDLVICDSVINKEANEQSKSLISHWAHMVVHGVLHLQGYDHVVDAEALEMEQLETQILEQLGFNDPYLK